ncbi:MAG TPA: site-specific integrase [Candidatus Sulfotelmatobacter sp.]
MQTFVDPKLLQRLRVGPLAPHLDAYLKQIEQEGFLPSSVPTQMYAIARFSNWLHDRRLDLRQVNEATVERFLQRDPGIVHSGEAAPLHRLLAMLRKIEVTPAKPPEPGNCQQRLVDDYRRYLLQERGLAKTSLLNYIPFAEQLLADRFSQSAMDLSKLTAQDITKFLQNRARQLCPGRAKLLVTALRSFLRYLRHQGQISVDLAGCVPSVAAWSLSTVPKFLPAGTVQQILDHCERDTPDGKRNYAVLLLLARLGLRACEIVELSLDDIDWDSGRITIRGKGGRWAQLPLPVDVGEAIAIYLQTGRPRCICRHVFLRHRASLRGFAHSITVSTIVRRALIRAGIDSIRKGAHLFRHTLATDLLRKGASLDEIGELLRHRSPNTTALYAKVDLTALRALALPWPGGVR